MIWLLAPLRWCELPIQVECWTNSVLLHVSISMFYTSERKDSGSVGRCSLLCLQACQIYSHCGRDTGVGLEGRVVGKHKLPPHGKYKDIFHILVFLLPHRISPNFCSEYKSVYFQSTQSLLRCLPSLSLKSLCSDFYRHEFVSSLFGLWFLFLFLFPFSLFRS